MHQVFVCLLRDYHLRRDPTLREDLYVNVLARLFAQLKTYDNRHTFTLLQS